MKLQEKKKFNNKTRMVLRSNPKGVKQKVSLRICKNSLMKISEVIPVLLLI